MVCGYLLFAYYTIYQTQSIHRIRFNIIGSIMLMDISYCQSGHVLLEKINSFDLTVINLSSTRFVVVILTRFTKRRRRSRDRMVVGFTTTFAISVYHH